MKITVNPQLHNVVFPCFFREDPTKQQKKKNSFAKEIQNRQNHQRRSKYHANANTSKG